MHLSSLPVHLRSFDAAVAHVRAPRAALVRPPRPPADLGSVSDAFCTTCAAAFTVVFLGFSGLGPYRLLFGLEPAFPSGPAAALPPTFVLFVAWVFVAVAMQALARAQGRHRSPEKPRRGVFRTAAAAREERIRRRLAPAVLEREALALLLAELDGCAPPAAASYRAPAADAVRIRVRAALADGAPIDPPAAYAELLAASL